MPSPHLIARGLDVLNATGVARLCSPLFRGRGIIFCLHQVLPGGGNPQGFAPNHQLEIAPEFLDSALSHIRARGYRLIGMHDVPGELRSRASPQPFAAFTLDDGYIDNLEHAASVFHKHRCPYTIYVNPGFVEGTAAVWWKLLEHVFHTSKRLELKLAGEPIDLNLSDDETRTKAWNRVFPIVRAMPEHEQRNWIGQLVAQAGVDAKSHARSLIMSWAELREIAGDPLCSIGAHTVNHFALRKLALEEAESEIAESRRRIEDELDRPAATFAYPYGDVADAGPRDFALAEKLGFELAVTTRKGVVHTGHAAHLFALPRVMMSGRYQSIGQLDALLSGTPLAILNGFRRINVS